MVFLSFSTAAEFLLKAALYEPQKCEDTHSKELAKLRASRVELDVHCVNCARETFFIDYRPSGGGAGRTPPPSDWMFRDGVFSVCLTCTRCKKDMLFYARMQDRTIQKIGQFPSVADLEASDLGQYRQALGKEYFVELKRAVGLFSHGVGIGAFVYLRRIFEKLIEDRAKELRDAGELPSGFETLRMDEKIAKIRSKLPESMYALRAIYSILSKGIHELTEDECKSAFPVMLSSIKSILNEEISLKQQLKDSLDLKAKVDELKKLHK